MIIGHGIDVVDIKEFSRLFTPLTIPYLDRYFTQDELAYSGSGVNKISRLAVRFAAKEAVLKTLGLGWGSGVSYTDVEVRTSKTGAPLIRLNHIPKSRSTALGITCWSISLSHSESTAMASAIAT